MSLALLLEFICGIFVGFSLCKIITSKPLIGTIRIEKDELGDLFIFMETDENKISKLHSGERAIVIIRRDLW